MPTSASARTRTGSSRAACGKGDNVALLARNTLNWALVDFALAQIGAVGIPVYASSSSRDVGYLLAHSEAVAIVCEDADQLAKVEAVTDELPALQHVLTYHDLDGLAAHGRDFAASHPTALDDATAAVSEDDLFTIIYTSGTTGPPKGCMLSNRNYYEMATVVDRMPGYYRRGRPHAPLPPARAQLRAADAAARRERRVHDRLPRRPAPRRRGAAAGAADAASERAARLREGVLRRPVPVRRGDGRATRGSSTGRSASDARSAASRRKAAPVPAGLRAKRSDRRPSRLHEGPREPLGGRLRMPGSGGAPLSKEIIEFFDAVGMRITEGYGLTECTTACSVNIPDATASAPSGARCPDSRSGSRRTARSRCARRPSSRATTRTPRRPRAVLGDDGWLKTGDIGETRRRRLPPHHRPQEGHPRHGRREERRAAEHRERPQDLEVRLTGARDRRPAGRTSRRSSRSIRSRSAGWAAENGVDGDVAALAADARVRELLQARRRRANRERSRFEQVKRFAVLPRDFTMEDGRDHADAQARRRAVQEHFADEIDALYAEPLPRRCGRRGRTSLEPAGADERAVLGEARDPARRRPCAARARTARRRCRCRRARAR